MVLAIQVTPLFLSRDVPVVSLGPLQRLRADVRAGPLKKLAPATRAWPGHAGSSEQTAESSFTRYNRSGAAHVPTPVGDDQRPTPLPPPAATTISSGIGVRLVA